MRSLRFLSLTALLVLLASCDGTISVTFSTGPQEFEVGTASLALPTELRDDASGNIASVPCGPMGMSAATTVWSSPSTTTEVTPLACSATPSKTRLRALVVVRVTVLPTVLLSMVMSSYGSEAERIPT